MKRTVAVTVFLVLPATLDGRNVQITGLLLVCTPAGFEEVKLLSPGSEPNTCIIYMPHLNHIFESVGSSDSAIIPVNAGTKATIIMKTAEGYEHEFSD